jgi:hypothetical protein
MSEQQDDKEATQSISDTCCVYKQIHYIKVRKNDVLLSVGNVHRIQRWLRSPFSSCLMQPGKE